MLVIVGSRVGRDMIENLIAGRWFQTYKSVQQERRVQHLTLEIAFECFHKMRMLFRIAVVFYGVYGVEALLSGLDMMDIIIS